MIERTMLKGKGTRHARVRCKNHIACLEKLMVKRLDKIKAL